MSDVPKFDTSEMRPWDPDAFERGARARLEEGKTEVVAPPPSPPENEPCPEAWMDGWRSSFDPGAGPV